jgi:hypothetical protein
MQRGKASWLSRFRWTPPGVELLLRSQRKVMQLLLDQRENALTFHEDGTLVVNRPSGETMTLTTTDGPFLKRRRGYGVYTGGSTEYVVYPGLLDPVESVVSEPLTS